MGPSVTPGRTEVEAAEEVEGEEDEAAEEAAGGARARERDVEADGRV